MSELFLLDTNVFLLGIDLNVLGQDLLTTPKILEEIKEIDRNRNILNKILIARNTNKLKVRTPSKEFLDKVKKASLQTGDFKALSPADRELIALALEIKETSDRSFILYSNDFTIQNSCAFLNIPYSSFVRREIKERITWEVYCPICKERFPSHFLNQVCENCGSKLKRRPINKNRAK